VVVGLCDRVNVMYAGHIVESAPVRGIFHRPSHGYTVRLLKSVPRLDRDTREPLEPIRGTPPDLIEISDVCPFLPRCPRRLSVSSGFNSVGLMIQSSYSPKSRKSVVAPFLNKITSN
jgi:oligopeptide/dipeptide ABC transporter ATP-binding protein